MAQEERIEEGVIHFGYFEFEENVLDCEALGQVAEDEPQDSEEEANVEDQDDQLESSKDIVYQHYLMDACVVVVLILSQLRVLLYLFLQLPHLEVLDPSHHL